MTPILLEHLNANINTKDERRYLDELVKTSKDFATLSVRILPSQRIIVHPTRRSFRAASTKKLSPN